jgi:hypothetical protein
MKHARTPAWIALINPIVGAAGVLIGAQIRRRPEPAPVVA